MKISELIETLAKTLKEQGDCEVIEKYHVVSSNKDILKIIELIQIQSDDTLRLLNRTSSESKRIDLIANRIKFEQAIELLKSLNCL